MPDQLTVGELRAIAAIVLCRAPRDSRERLAARIETHVRTLPEVVTHG